MSLYVTEIEALDPNTGEIKKWDGPQVPGISFYDAQYYCNTHGLGYCKVIGKLVSEIPTKPDGLTPDWDKRIDYDTPELN